MSPQLLKYVLIHSEGTEYIIHARTEPDSEYTEVIPALANLKSIVCNGTPWRI